MSDDLTPAEQARAARWAAGWLARHPDFGTVSALGLLDRHAESLDPPETVESLREELRQGRDELAAMRVDRDALAEERDEAREKQAHWQEQRDDAVDNRDLAESVIRVHIAALDELRAERDSATKKLSLAECVITDQRAACKSMRAEWDRIDDARKAALDAMRAERDAARMDAEIWELLYKVDVRDKLGEQQDVAAERAPRVWHVGDDEPDDVTRVVDREHDVWVKGDGECWSTQVLSVSIRQTWGEMLDDYAPLTEVLTKSVAYED